MGIDGQAQAGGRHGACRVNYSCLWFLESTGLGGFKEGGTCREGPEPWPPGTVSAGCWAPIGHPLLALGSWALPSPSSLGPAASPPARACSIPSTQQEWEPRTEQLGRGSGQAGPRCLAQLQPGPALGLWSPLLLGMI